MADDREHGIGGFGGLFADNCAILWFIILFLLLFYGGGFGHGAGIY